MNRGFSIIELLVSIGIFSLLISVVVGIFIGSVRSQTSILANQRITGEIRYVVENISRIGMLARTDIEASCLSESEKTYEFAKNEFRFIDYRQRCNIYELKEDAIYRTLKGDGGTIKYQLTSPEFIVQEFDVEIVDDPHERVLLFVEMGMKGADVWLHAQTTFSKRTLR